MGGNGVSGWGLVQGFHPTPHHTHAPPPSMCQCFSPSLSQCIPLDLSPSPCPTQTVLTARGVGSWALTARGGGHGP